MDGVANMKFMVRLVKRAFRGLSELERIFWGISVAATAIAIAQGAVLGWYMALVVTFILIVGYRRGISAGHDNGSKERTD